MKFQLNRVHSIGLFVFVLAFTSNVVCSEVEVRILENVGDHESQIDKYDYFFIVQPAELRDIVDVGFVNRIALPEKSKFNVKDSDLIVLDEFAENSRFFVIQRPGKENAIPYKVVQKGVIGDLIQTGILQIWNTSLSFSIHLKGIADSKVLKDLELELGKQSRIELKRGNEAHSFIADGVVVSVESEHGVMQFDGKLQGASPGVHWCKIVAPVNDVGKRQLLHLDFLLILSEEDVNRGDFQFHTNKIFKASYEYFPKAPGRLLEKEIKGVEK